MMPVTSEQYLEAIEVQSTVQATYESHRRRFWVSTGLCVLSSVVAVAGERRGAPDGITGTAVSIQLGAVAMMLKSTFDISRCKEKFSNALGSTDAYESATMHTIASSEQGQELAFIADVIDPLPKIRDKNSED